MADFPDVAADSGDKTILSAGAYTTRIVATNHGGKWKLMRGVGGRVVMKRPDHDVCIQTGEADEERSRALVLKARRVDAYFVESQVIRLAGDIPGAERTTDHRRVRGEESHAVDCLETAFSFDAVSNLNWSEAS